LAFTLSFSTESLYEIPASHLKTTGDLTNKREFGSLCDLGQRVNNKRQILPKIVTFFEKRAPYRPQSVSPLAYTASKSWDR
jgi:hypothetical protein